MREVADEIAEEAKRRGVQQGVLIDRGSLCCAAIKVRIADNQDEKVVAWLAPQGGRSPTGDASTATIGDKALSRASIVM
jgi:hypothetical protein